MISDKLNFLEKKCISVLASLAQGRSSITDTTDIACVWEKCESVDVHIDCTDHISAVPRLASGRDLETAAPSLLNLSPLCLKRHDDSQYKPQWFRRHWKSHGSRGERDAQTCLYYAMQARRRQQAAGGDDWPRITRPSPRPVSVQPPCSLSSRPYLRADPSSSMLPFIHAQPDLSVDAKDYWFCQPGPRGSPMPSAILLTAHRRSYYVHLREQ
jgi:hypothetical protein